MHCQQNIKTFWCQEIYPNLDV